MPASCSNTNRTHIGVSGQPVVIGHGKNTFGRNGGKRLVTAVFNQKVEILLC